MEATEIDWVLTTSRTIESLAVLQMNVTLEGISTINDSDPSGWKDSLLAQLRQQWTQKEADEDNDSAELLKWKPAAQQWAAAVVGPRVQHGRMKKAKCSQPAATATATATRRRAISYTVNNNIFDKNETDLPDRGSFSFTNLPTVSPGDNAELGSATAPPSPEESRDNVAHVTYSPTTVDGRTNVAYVTRYPSASPATPPDDNVVELTDRPTTSPVGENNQQLEDGPSVITTAPSILAVPTTTVIPSVEPDPPIVEPTTSPIIAPPLLAEPTSTIDNTFFPTTSLDDSLLSTLPPTTTSESFFIPSITGFPHATPNPNAAPVPGVSLPPDASFTRHPVLPPSRFVEHDFWDTDKSVAPTAAPFVVVQRPPSRSTDAFVPETMTPANGFNITRPPGVEDAEYESSPQNATDNDNVTNHILSIETTFVVVSTNSESWMESQHSELTAAFTNVVAELVANRTATTSDENEEALGTAMSMPLPPKQQRTTPWWRRHKRSLSYTTTPSTTVEMVPNSVQLYFYPMDCPNHDNLGSWNCEQVSGRYDIAVTVRHDNQATSKNITHLDATVESIQQQYVNATHTAIINGALEAELKRQFPDGSMPLTILTQNRMEEGSVSLPTRDDDVYEQDPDRGKDEEEAKSENQQENLAGDTTVETVAPSAGSYWWAILVAVIAFLLIVSICWGLYRELYLFSSSSSTRHTTDLGEQHGSTNRGGFKALGDGSYDDESPSQQGSFVDEQADKGGEEQSLRDAPGKGDTVVVTFEDLCEDVAQFHVGGDAGV